MADFVILVDKNDNEIGVMEKIEAHQKALLHRAFSIFIFNTKGELMLQQRAAHKYHSPKLWTNTCCSHQKPKESTISAANRRLVEEMGLKCDLEEIFTFIYQTPFDNGLTEHELDHVLIGISNDNPKLNPEEAMDFKYINMNKLTDDIAKNEDNYTSWFKICLPRVKQYFDSELLSKFKC